MLNNSKSHQEYSDCWNIRKKILKMLSWTVFDSMDMCLFTLEQLCSYWPNITSSDCLTHFTGGVPASNAASIVRLVDGNFVGQGRLEIYQNGEWGTVCDDYWSITNSDVVCQELGFESAVAFYINVGDVGVVPVRFETTKEVWRGTCGGHWLAPIQKRPPHSDTWPRRKRRCVNLRYTHYYYRSPCT